MGGVAVVALVAASMALAARGYSDAAGDSNSAPDITSVEVGEATPGVLAIRLSVGNYASLPARSWVNLWFDLDSDQETGAAGDEALVRYSADGGVELYRVGRLAARRRLDRRCHGVVRSGRPDGLAASRLDRRGGVVRHARRELARAVSRRGGARRLRLCAGRGPLGVCRPGRTRHFPTLPATTMPRRMSPPSASATRRAAGSRSRSPPRTTRRSRPSPRSC